MPSRLTALEPVASELARRAAASGTLAIFRAQERLVHRVVVREGRAESSSSQTLGGHGVQVVNTDGYGALASGDALEGESVLDSLARATDAASQGERLGLKRVGQPTLDRVRDRRHVVSPEPFEAVDLTEVTRRLIDLERSIREETRDVTVQVSFRAELDSWRIFRSDRTDVWFSMPRCTLGMRATATGERQRHGVSAVQFSPDPALLESTETVERFLRRARAAARLAHELPDAPAHPSGSFPLIIDFALAKGLAHEAFGHAAEADGYRSSILADDGRFKLGERVGPDHVSVVDESIEGDHAFQPFSANGIPRERTVIVDRGRLAGGLSDPWSAAPGGVALTGAARAESYFHAPQPRMSNIRLESRTPLPVPGVFEDYGSHEVRDLVADAGLLRRHPRWVFLSGYSGGQVNTTTGDFVFHCKAIYDLTADGVGFFKPAIFSGSMFGALQSVREAFGPLELDALGYCGKWGQSVPSSGGSHYFLALEPHESVRLGGQ